METEVKTTSADADIGGEQEKQSAPSFFEKLRHPFRYKFQFKIVPSKSSDKPDAEDAEEGGSDTAGATSAKKEKKPKKEKKKKEKKKKEKKKKEKKPKKAKPKKTAKDKKEKGGSKKLILLIVLISVVLAAVICTVLILRSGSNPEARLAKADKYVEDEKFDKAIDIYNKLIDEEELVVQAYLGVSYAYVGLEEDETAVTKLQIGYEETRDNRLHERLLELSPEELAVEVGEPLPANAIITFTDTAFESMLRPAMGKSASEPIYQSDLDSIRSLRIVGDTYAAINQSANIFEGEAGEPIINSIESYTIDGVTYTTHGAIRSLDDLAYFQNLTRLTISFNEVQDISGLRNLTSLNTLTLYCNNISDISPLSGLTNLQYLYLYDNNISDISALSGLTRLQQLLLQYNQITDLSPLRGMSSLQQLFVSHNQISDLSPVGSLSGLQQLFASNNQISDISALSGMEKLKFFYAMNNQISDISVLASLSALTDVALSGNPISDYSPVANVATVDRPLGRTGPY